MLTHNDDDIPISSQVQLGRARQILPAPRCAVESAYTRQGRDGSPFIEPFLTLKRRWLLLRSSFRPFLRGAFALMLSRMVVWD